MSDEPTLVAWVNCDDGNTVDICYRKPDDPEVGEVWGVRHSKVPIKGKTQATLDAAARIAELEAALKDTARVSESDLRIASRRIAELEAKVEKYRTSRKAWIRNADDRAKEADEALARIAELEAEANHLIAQGDKTPTASLYGMLYGLRRVMGVRGTDE